MGARISAASSPCRTTCSSRWRCATTATSSACTIRRSATAAASPSRSFGTSADRLLDLGTKGSGQTPYSRTADGRLTLKGGVREVLATEMLEALGVNTSKTFALFETGEELVRGDEPSPTRSSVLTRLSHGHIRIGTFQRLAFYGEVENINALVRYCLEQSLRRGRRRGRRPRMRCACSTWSPRATARLAASYMAAGFVHGVLNSDNINVTGESFDYGPWRFTPDWDPDFTAAYFDHYGLYSFGRQPEAIHWDLAQFAGCMSLVAEAPPLSEMLAGWSDRFEDELVAALLRRLGVEPTRSRSRPRARRRAAEALCSPARRRSTGSSSTGAAAAIPARSDIRREHFRALASALEGRERRAHASLLVGRGALLDAYRGGRSHLVGHRRK